MRIFTFSAIVTIVLGLGTAAALADGARGQPAAGGPVVTAPDPATSQYVKIDRALQRLELEATLEDFYAEIRGRAEGLDTAGREALYQEAERRLQRLILGSETYAGEQFAKGVDYLEDARLVLARTIGLQAPPAGGPRVFLTALPRLP